MDVNKKKSRKKDQRLVYEKRYLISAANYYEKICSKLILELEHKSLESDADLKEIYDKLQLANSNYNKFCKPYIRFDEEK